MRILQVIPYFRWSYGGPVRVACELSKSLAKRNHEVAIFTTDVGDSRDAMPDHVADLDTLVTVDSFRVSGKALSERLKFHFSEDMRKALKSRIREFDVIHLHEWRGMANAYVWYYARKAGVPYVIQAHGSSPLVLPGQTLVRGVSKALYDSVIGPNVTDGAKSIIALTDKELRQLVERGVDPSKIVIIPNGIDRSKFERLPERGRFRAAHGMSEKEKLMLYLGRLDQIKGIDILVEAFSKVAKSQPDLRLAVVGPDFGDEGRLRAMARDLGIQESVIFSGPLYGDDKTSVFVDSDLFVLPSRYEAFPISVLEACSCGVPILVFNNCGISEIVNDIAGLSVESNRAALEKGMATLLADDQLRTRYSSGGKTLVRDNFDLSIVTSKFERLYRSVSQTRHDRG